MSHEVSAFEGFDSESKFRQFKIGVQIEWDLQEISLQERSILIEEMDSFLYVMLGHDTYVPPAHTYAHAYVSENSWAKHHHEVNYSTYGFMNNQHAVAFRLRFG